MPEWGLGGGIVSTAAPAAALVRLIARGGIGAVGVLAPERCVDPDELFGELERRGCAFAIDVCDGDPDGARDGDPDGARDGDPDGAGDRDPNGARPAQVLS
jgi:hypothetical protein